MNFTGIMDKRAGVLVVALAAAIAVASRGTPVWAELRFGPVDRLALLANVAIVGGAGLVGAFALTLAYHRAVVANRPDARPLRATLDRALPAGSVALAALVLLTIAASDTTGRAGNGVSRNPVDLPDVDRPFWSITDDRMGLMAGEDRREEVTGEDVAGFVGRDPRLLFALAAVVVLLAGWMASRSYSRPPPRPVRVTGQGSDEAIDTRAMHTAVTSTIDHMIADPDPRTSVIGAYARLLEGLSGCGVPRRQHEAPLEHLQRALGRLRVRPEPVRQLVQLFEIARFSTHPLTARHRELALESLRGAAADLAQSAGGPAQAGVVGTTGAPR